MKQPGQDVPLQIEVLVAPAYIWCTGAIGKVTISQDFGDDLELTIAQAKSLITVLRIKLNAIGEIV